MTRPAYMIGRTEHPDAQAWYADFKARVRTKDQAEAFAKIHGQDVRALAGTHGVAEAYWIIDDLLALGVLIKPE